MPASRGFEAVRSDAFDEVAVARVLRGARYAALPYSGAIENWSLHAPHAARRWLPSNGSEAESQGAFNLAGRTRILNRTRRWLRDLAVPLGIDSERQVYCIRRRNSALGGAIGWAVAAWKPRIGL